MRPHRDPIGVILAGGKGRRIGGEKAMVALRGRPLIQYPLDALKAALTDVAVIAKPDTELPALPGVTLWVEPALPSHPLAGIVEAIELARGRHVLVCAGDLPFVTPDLIERLAAFPSAGAPVVVTALEGRTQPLLACYAPAAAALLGGVAGVYRRPLRDTVAGIGARVMGVEDPELLFNVNTPEDLRRAAALLDRRRASRR
jgi:molybdopterin-guanine dinucleotide biosynthesis protein A